MTLAVQTVRQLYNGNGATTSFAIPFAFEANDEVEVILVSSADVETLQAYTTHYTISGSNVVMITAPASGEKLLVLYAPDYDQETDLADSTPFLPSTLEGELDEIVGQIQSLKEIADRCIKVPKSSALTNVEVPRSFTGKAGYVPSVNDDEDGFEFDVSVADIQDAIDAGAAAAASAASAASSASSAASSATDAAASEAAAAASEVAAAASAAAALAAVAGTEIQEMLSGTVDGSNPDFTTSQTPTSAASFKLFRSGVLLILGTHYTRSGTTVTMINAPVSPQYIHAVYRY